MEQPPPPHHFPQPTMVPHPGDLPDSPGDGLLQRLRLRPHRLIPRLQLRQARHLRVRPVGRCQQRRRPRRTHCLRHHDEHRLLHLRSDAGLQDGLPHAGVTQVDDRQPDRGHGHGYLRDLLQVLPVGLEGAAYPAPYAQVYRGIALVGVQGFSVLPKNCLSLCLGFFLGAMALNGVRVAVER